MTPVEILILQLKQARDICDNDDRLYVYNMIIDKLEDTVVHLEKELIIHTHKQASIEAGFEHSAEDWANEYFNRTFKSYEDGKISKN